MGGVAEEGPPGDTVFKVKVEGYAGPDVQTARRAALQPKGRRHVQRGAGRKGLGLF